MQYWKFSSMIRTKMHSKYKHVKDNGSSKQTHMYGKNYEPEKENILSSQIVHIPTSL